MKHLLMNLAVFFVAACFIAGAFKFLANLGILVSVIIVLCGWSFLRHRWPGYF